MRWQTKYVNENYFDLEGRTSDELKRIHYVWGAFIAGCTPIGYHGIEFRSRHLELAKIVKRELDIEHKIRPNDVHSYFIRIEKAPKLRSALEGMGLTEDKYQRKFPDVPTQYLGSLVRGFIDQRAVVYESNRGTAKISIASDQLLLKGLNKALVNHAGIKRGPPTRNTIEYSIADSVKIHSLCYSDWDFIQQYGLYVPAIKQMMEINVNRNVPIHHNTREVMARIEEAKRYLLEGYTATEAGKKVGYNHVSNFMQAFKKVTGQTTTQFLEARQRLKMPIIINFYGNPTPRGRREY